MTIELFGVIVLMGLVAYGCKVAGFWAIRYVPLTGRLKAGLAAVPIAVMAAILAPLAVQGDGAELAALSISAAVMAIFGIDLIAVGLGLAVLVLARLAGF